MDLFIFDKILEDKTINALLEKNNTDLLRGVVNFAETEGVTDDSLREYVAAKLANDENVLSSLVREKKTVGDDLLKLAMLDIDMIFNRIFNTKIKYKPSGNDTGFCDAYINSIKRITKSENADELLESLVNHYETLGNGLLSRYIAFRFDGELSGIPNSDKSTFDDIVGMEHQKKVLIDNTKAFVDGKFANNVLLFGD